jgi:Ser/Thr protein kinase RdoA (MazF antagonist)
MKRGRGVDSVLHVLDYTKSNKAWFDGHELYAGYHSVSIQGEKFKGQRDPELRLAKLDYDFRGKRVLDIGCSNGGLLHALAPTIAFGVGVDVNARCINAANALKAVNRTDNVHFFTFDLDKEELSILGHFVLGEPVDICLFLNLSLWIKRWKEAFEACARQTRTLLFEAHGNEKQQQEQLAFVRTVYGDVRLVSEQSDDDPTYSKRKTYLCEGRIAGLPASEGRDAGRAEYLQVFDEASVRLAYERTFVGEKARAIRFFPDTYESVVAEIDGAFIVKLPRPGRDARGLEVERAVTDFVRERVAVAVPKMSLHTSSVLLARYPKLPGIAFDSTRYESLSESKKEDLAEQLARFMAALHAVSPEQIERHAIPSAPSWQLSTELIESQLANEKEPAIEALVPHLVRNHKALQVPASNVVFGHFDLHGSNVLFDERHERLTAVLDFGNCRPGDLHQDLSVMNLSSTDLAERMARHYAALSGRDPNRLLVQHYTTIFYLNLLADLKRKRASGRYAYWLGELNKWYEYLVADRAAAKLKARAPASSLPPAWRRWLASNLMKGSAPDTLQSILREKGFAHVDIATELTLARQHPYVQAGQEIFQTLAKRNWLLRTVDGLSALDERYSRRIEVRRAPPFDAFVREYYSKHLPVVLTGAVDCWPALRKWTPEYLLREFGDAQVEVQSGRESDPQYERNAGRHKKKLLMKEFIGRFTDGGSSNDYYMTANNTRDSITGIERLFEDIGDFAAGYREAATIRSGNFFWFGPRGTFTPLHHDLTNNMLVQILGRKKVTLIPAFQVPWLYNDMGVFSAADYPRFDESRYPLMKKVTPVEVILNPAESLFIPIGWWHCVEALDVSISISFTNFNAPNHFSADYPR